MRLWAGSVLKRLLTPEPDFEENVMIVFKLASFPFQKVILAPANAIFKRSYDKQDIPPLISCHGLIQISNFLTTLSLKGLLPQTVFFILSLGNIHIPANTCMYFFLNFSSLRISLTF